MLRNNSTCNTFPCTMPLTEKRKRKSVSFPTSVLMQQAITAGDLKQMIQLICVYGKSVVNVCEPSGLSPAMRCVFESRTAALHILVEAGANLSHRDSENWTALHVAASMDDLTAAKLILKRCKQDLTQLRSVDGERPIDLAQSPEMVRLLKFAESKKNQITYMQERIVRFQTHNANLKVLHRRRLTIRLTDRA